MYNNYGITPEEMLLKKKRNRYLLYVVLFIATIALSAGVTVIANKL